MAYNDSSNEKKSLSQLVKDNDSSGLVRYFLNEVPRIADKYSKDVVGIDFKDIIATGNLALTEFFSSKMIFRHNIEERALEAIEQAIRDYVLSEQLYRMRVDVVDYNTLDEIIRSSGYDVERKLDAVILRKHINEFMRGKKLDGKERLSELDKIVLDAYFGLGNFTECSGYSKIGKLVGRSLERCRQSVLKSIHSFHRNVDIMQDLYEYYHTISDKLFVYGKEDNPYSLEVAIKRVKSEILNASSRSLQEFMTHFYLSARRLADFISFLEPSLSNKNAVRLVELTETEKERLQSDRLIYFERVKDIDAMKRTLSHLEEKKMEIEHSLKADISERIRESYMPLYSRDRERCLELIEFEANNGENSTELRKLFMRTRKYFDDVSRTEIRGIRSELDDFQKVDVDIMSSRRANIIASDMGTGKSLESIAYAMKNDLRRVLVISTKTGAYVTWPLELKKHCKDIPNIIFVNSRIRDKIDDSSSGWFLSSYSATLHCADVLKAAKFDYIILDECHHVNNPFSQTSRVVTSLDAPHRTAMSGFLFKNDRKELFPILNWLFPETFSEREAYEYDYCKSEQGLGLLQYELGKRMILRFKDDVIKLPSVVEHIESIKMASKQRSEYLRLEEDFVNWYESHLGSMSDKNLNRIILSKLHSLRNKTIEFKAPMIDEIVRNAILNEERRCVIYTTYRKWASEFRKRLFCFNPCYIDGTSSGRDRRNNVKLFDEDPSRGLFVITKAGGESVELTSASCIIYGNKPLTYADEKQALDRVHRRGQKRKVHSYNLVVEDTIDERIENLLDSKKREYREVVQDAVGLRRWYEESESDNIRGLVGRIINKDAV